MGTALWAAEDSTWLFSWGAGAVGAAGRCSGTLAGGGGGGAAAAKLGENVDAPGLKLKEEALGFSPPLVGAGDGCSVGSNSSLSSQLIVS